MSAEMGYHWGQVDAEQVLAVLDLDKKVVWFRSLGFCA
jgi:hypothetical protein